MSVVKDILIIFGPPGSPAEKERFAQLAKTRGKSEPELFCEYMHEAFTYCSSRQGNDKSIFDDLFSRLLDKDVRVNDAFSTYQFRADGPSPAIIFDTKNILTNDQPITANFDDPAFKNALGAALGYAFKTEWVHVIVSSA